MFLGGPLYYDLGLRQRFTETLKLSPENAVFPSFALFAVAAGAAIYADTHGEEILFEDLIDKLKSAAAAAPATVRMPPLFREQAEYEAFKARHAAAKVKEEPPFRLHRKGLARHRLRLDHHKAGTYRGEETDPPFLLQLQPRQSRRASPGAASQNVRALRRPGADLRQRRHRLR